MGTGKARTISECVISPLATKEHVPFSVVTTTIDWTACFGISQVITHLCVEVACTLCLMFISSHAMHKVAISAVYGLALLANLINMGQINASVLVLVHNIHLSSMPMVLGSLLMQRSLTVSPASRLQ